MTTKFETLYKTKPESDEARLQKMPLMKDQVLSGLEDSIRKLRSQNIDNSIKRNEMLKKLVEGDISVAKEIVKIDVEKKMSDETMAAFEELKKELFEDKR